MKIKFLLLFLLLAVLMIMFAVWWRAPSPLSSMRENPNLLRYKQLQVGDYLINTVDDGISNFLFVVQAVDNIKFENETASVNVQMAPNKQVTVVLGDSANRLFFAKHTPSEQNFNLPFVSKKIIELDQNTRGKIFVMTIPLYSQKFDQYIQSSDCTEYCQNNIKKIKKFNSMYLQSLVNNKKTIHIFNPLNKLPIVGPVVQLVELE